MKDQKRTLFVGGPRHGKVVIGQPTIEGEPYRVPAANPKDDPIVYKATEITLTFPDPVTGKPGETHSCFVYVIPLLYPDNPEQTQNLQAALMDAALRQIITANGIRVTGGPAAVAAQRIPVFVAWCDECPPGVNMPADYPSAKDRAAWMADHQTTTGHTARWENRER